MLEDTSEEVVKGRTRSAGFRNPVVIHLVVDEQKREPLIITYQC